MFNTNLLLYLASSSPRRKAMLNSLGIKYKTLVVEFDEKINPNESPIKNVKRLAKEKCLKSLESISNGWVITADTIVVLNNKIIGKPTSNKNAKNILKNLSGKTHLVYTGFAIGNGKTKKILIDYEKTKVTFYDLSPRQIDKYIQTGSPMDKAGAYGIQDDLGTLFVKKINGCYNNVVGFPIAKIVRSLEQIT